MPSSSDLHVLTHQRSWDMATMTRALWDMESTPVSARAIASKYNLPHATLSRYWNEMPERFKAIGIRNEQEVRDWLDQYHLEHTCENGYSLLTPDQEHHLIQWISFAHTINHPLSAEHIKLLAREIIKTHKGIEIECQNQTSNISVTRNYMHTFSFVLTNNI